MIAAIRAHEARRVGILVLLVSITLCSCEGEKPQVGFIDRSEDAGFTSPNHTGVFEDKPYLVCSKGGGILSLDYDDDGDADIYLIDGNELRLGEGGVVLTKRANPQAGNRLYRNDGDWKFTDVTSNAGVGDKSFGIGGTVGDYDGDGDRDILVCNWGENVLYRNDGNGTFTDVTEEAGVAGAENDFSTCATFLDADADGDLDLYVSNYGDNEELMTRTEGEAPGSIVAGTFHYSGPGCYLPQLDRFYRNGGDGTFVEETETALAGQLPSYGFQPVSIDVDNDGDTDLYVANDSMPNFLWVNDGTGRFEDRAPRSGCAVNETANPSAGMGVDAADYNQDGWVDLVVTNFSADWNNILRNDTRLGYLMFEHRAIPLGFGMNAWDRVCWGVGFRDFNQDGYLDIFVSAGHVYPTPARDVRVRSSYYEQAPLLYMSGGPPTWKFTEVGASSGPGMSVRRLGRGALFEDLDGDGDQDVVITCLNSTPLALENRLEGLGHWLKVKLVGTTCNRDALGARVTVEAGNGRLAQMHELRYASSFAASHHVSLHWGLGDATVADRVTVAWPGGATQVFTNLPADRAYRIVEGEEAPVPVTR